MKSLILLALVAALNLGGSSAGVISPDSSSFQRLEVYRNDNSEERMNSGESFEEGRMGGDYPVYQGFYTITYGPAVPVGAVAAGSSGYRTGAEGAGSESSEERIRFGANTVGQRLGHGGKKPHIERAILDDTVLYERMGEGNFPVYQGFYTITYGPAVPVGAVAAGGGPAYRVLINGERLLGIDFFGRTSSIEEEAMLN